jgi:YD repeat-containing protein
MSSRRLVELCVLLVLLAFGWFAAKKYSSRQPIPETPKVIIQKQPVAFATHTFDPVAPPADMPPLSAQETAACDSSFRSGASVRGESRKSDATHATVTVTLVKVTLQLNVNIWVPSAASPQLIDHEEGHRQISEYYYDTADKLAEQIASTYIGKQVEITGSDLNAESNKALQQIAAEITDEYNKQLNPAPTQLFYDSITGHGRNGALAKDAVAHALKNIPLETP